MPRIARKQGMNQRLGGAGFAHRYRMDPQAGRVEPRTVNTETLGEVFEIGRLSPRAPQQAHQQ